MDKPSITLRPGREKSVLLKHPWIFASAIEKVTGNPDIGDTVCVYDSRKNLLAKAAYNENSQIRGRIWSWGFDDEINQEFLEKKISESIQRRKTIFEEKKTNAVRLVYGEADGIPGLIVDQFEKSIVVQILSAGPEKFRLEIYQILDKLIEPDQIIERSDVDVRALEGLPERAGRITGKIESDEVIIEENEVKYQVNLIEGQKTGFYIDQKENRQKVQGLVKGRRILNCFCYTGGFTFNALAGGADSVISMDSSASALVQLNKNILLNQFDEKRNQNVEGDVFKLLRLYRDKAESFDMIILDPPKFAPTTAQAEKAARGYKDINLLAFKLLRPGGILVTFSCSGGISRELFQKIVTSAASDANVDARIQTYLSQGPDHPVLLNFPESFYLKGLICQI